MAAPVPLDLERRPISEGDAGYLAALRKVLIDLGLGSSAPRIEVVPVSIIAATHPSTLTPVTLSHGRASGPSDGRCAQIIAQVQLGESLSEADRKILQTSCH
jgi:hypothetical protein